MDWRSLRTRCGFFVKAGAMTRIVSFLICCLLASAAAAQLSSTQPLDWPEEDLSARMMDGAHRFVERKIAEAEQERSKYWKFDIANPAPYEASIRENRERLREIIGAVDPRLPPRLERFGDDENPALVAETPAYRVYQVRWAVLDGVDGEGLLIEPTQAAVARMVAIPDADQTPEQVMGLAPGIPPEQQFARRMAESGCEVVIPVLVDRRPLATSDPQIQRSQQTSREWLYRQAFHMGRHPIGYEVQKVLAAVDWFRAKNDAATKIGVAGYAEGGLIAFYAAAVDTRIDAALISGYFDTRRRVWSEPIYRNVWGLHKRFGDSEMAGLIQPRPLVVEHAPVPEIKGHKGDWQTPENEKIASQLRYGFMPQRVSGRDGAPIGPGSEEALNGLLKRLALSKPLAPLQAPGTDARKSFDPAARHERTVKQIEQHVQNLIRKSEQVREKSFLLSVMPEFSNARWNTEKSLPTKNANQFIERAKAFRERFAVEAMGRFDEPMMAPNPRTRKLIENDRWTAYDVVLDVWPEVFAWGVLVVPKDIRPGERRPVVVCQHGRNGLPRMLVDGNETAYNQFAARLAERGFVTFAPHNLYRGEDRYRWLCRKANSVEATLFSFIFAQHDQILRWLEQQPFVDGKRMAFYGLSYGGETAVRVPPILEKYCLSICSGDFNQWTTKVAATDQPFSFMRTIEWEMPYWNLGQTFDYAEMAYLMLPRPFMVERGHLDLVGRDAWVAHEYAKVRWLYAQLGLADRTEIEYFQGGHSIHGEGTFRFLHKHLDWPAPAGDKRAADR
jgi:dienelactone hydrolase